MQASTGPAWTEVVLPRCAVQAYAAEVEQEQQERLALEQRIRAMESKVPAAPPACLGLGHCYGVPSTAS